MNIKMMLMSFVKEFTGVCIFVMQALAVVGFVLIMMSVITNIAQPAAYLTEAHDFMVVGVGLILTALFLFLSLLAVMFYLARCPVVKQ